MSIFRLKSEAEQEIVGKYAARLDEIMPAWEKKINLKTLNVEYTTKDCIVGQLYPGIDYNEALDDLERKGFYDKFSQNLGGFFFSTEIWENEIKKRLQTV